MKKIIDVARYEYIHHVAKRRFWIALLGMPVGFLLIMALSMLFSYLSFDTEPVGYVDQANLITQPQEVPEKIGFMDIFIQLIPYADEETARADTENGILQGYVVIPAGYQSTYNVTYYSNEQPGSEVLNQINWLIRENMLLQQQIPHLDRIEAGSQISLQSLDGSQSSDGTGWHRIFVPILIGILYFILVMSCGSYLLQSLVEEKQNRTMEIMITSMSPNQLMIGKIIGNLGVGFTQILVWVVILAIGLLVFRDRLPFLGDLSLSPGYMAISLALLVLAFIVSAGLISIIGATMSTVEEGQSVNGLMVLPTMLPFYFFQTFLSNPNGIIPRILSYFPLSAPLSLSLRMAFTKIPTWEIISVFAILIISIALVFWLSGKAFRRGLLEYSKKLKLRDLFVKEANNG
ncbi:MAG: ABC transporter permease [Anaerolineaceae bacterium]|jgi:ABC-2 type transport system permease protein|nr:ABC transporter permease [Anaerolineaceae bacterium]